MIGRPIVQRRKSSHVLRTEAIALLLALSLAGPITGHAETKIAQGKAEHVVLVVWDGMRPDFVTENYTPNLSQLAEGGVRFRNHHSIYPSLTSVNATALATGVYPNRSGMFANWAFWPEISGGKLARLDAPETIRKGDEISGGKYLGAATIAELVQARGGRTAIVGTKTAALLHDRKSSAVRSSTKSVTLFDGETLPPDAITSMTKLLGPFPTEQIPNKAQDAWTTRALTEVLWKDGVPEFSLLWMSDPDRSQHATAPGTEAALAGIKSVDANLGIILHALEEKGVRDKTDILLASDHGFSTIERSIDVADFLRSKDFAIAGEDETKLARGQIRVAGNGGTNLYYIGGHDEATAARLIEALQQTDFTGVIFSRWKIEGTFPLSQVHIETASGPDVVMTFRWNDGRNAKDVLGMIAVNGSGDAYKGTHGTLSSFDVHNTFIAAGPDFRRRLKSDTPTSNIDVAATVLHLLGLVPPQPVDGRVVSEALTSGGADPPAANTETLEISHALSSGTWHQQLRISKIGSSEYFDEGNGEFRKD